MASQYLDLPTSTGGGGGGVSSFNGRSGSVVSTSGDYTAVQITNVPAGNISSTDVQSALNELDSEKQPLITGAATTITNSNLTANRALQSDGSGKVAVNATTAAELAFVSGTTSNIQSQINTNTTNISNKQPLDATLTSLAAFNTNGFVVQTAADTFAGRTLQTGSTRLSITNPAGASGDPSLDVVEANINKNNLGGGVLSIANGGTNASTAPLARVSLNIDERTTFNNAPYTALSTDRYIAQIGTLSASRTVTLPLANSVNAGQLLMIVDESGTASATNNITISRSGSDTINKSAASSLIITPFGRAFLYSDGVSNWTDTITGLTRGGTGATTAAGSRVTLDIDQRSTFSDAPYTVLSTDRYVAQIGTMSAPRVVTLPLANSVNPGQELRIVDESGTVTTTNILTITASGADTIDGAASKTIRSAYGIADLTSNGTNMWYRPVTGIGAGGTALSTTPTNGQLLIGNTTTSAYNLNTLTAGPGITITNGAGTIQINNSSIGVGTLPPGLVGDGVDGDVTISGPVTLARDMYYNSLTVNAGQTLNMGGFIIFVKGTVLINATGFIIRNGTAGGNAATSSAGAAGAAVAGTTVGASGAGAAGGAGGVGNGASGATSAAVSGEGGVGGVGGNGGQGNGGATVGGSGGNAGVLTPRYFREVQSNWKYTAVGTFMPTGVGGAGGAAGGGDGVNSGRGGGGGGSAGGPVFIICDTLNNLGTIQSKGGTGGNGGGGALGNVGGGAGGGGGGGGKIMILANTITAAGTLDVSGGAAGTGSSGAGTGSAGTNGSVGSNGFATTFNAGTGIWTTTS